MNITRRYEKKQVKKRNRFLFLLILSFFVILPLEFRCILTINRITLYTLIADERLLISFMMLLQGGIMSKNVKKYCAAVFLCFLLFHLYGPI
jgi:hypothetical protein